MERRILLVDDDTDFLEMLSSKIRFRFGDSVDLTLTSSAMMAIVQLSDQKSGENFDLVVCDRSMPNKAGEAVFEFIESSLFTQTKFIMLTGDEVVSTKFLVIGKGELDKLFYEIDSLIAPSPSILDPR